MEDSGWKPGKLAKAEDVVPGTVSAWRSGEKPDDLRLPRLANRFGVRVEWLRDGEEPRRSPDPWPLRGVAEGGRIRPVTVDVYVPTPSLSRGAMPPALVMEQLDRIAGRVREVLQDLTELRALIPAASSLGTTAPLSAADAESLVDEVPGAARTAGKDRQAG